MRCFADSSFVVSAFVRDEFNRKVWQWWRRHPQATVLVTSLVIFEAQNAIRAFPLSGKCPPEAARAALDGIKRALLEGLLTCQNVPAGRLFPQANRLSQHHSNKVTFGAMDILHVASAMELGTTMFLTFDERQGQMAEAEGLELKPGVR